MDKKTAFSKIVLSCLFFAGFLPLALTSLADSFRVSFLYRSVTVPVYQWLAVLAFITIWKKRFDTAWRGAFFKGLFLGMALCLYFPLLSTQKQLWGPSPLSRIYLVYINAFALFFNILMQLAGSLAAEEMVFADRRERRSFFSDALFFPSLLSSAYGILFYYRNHHIREAAILLITFLAFLVFVMRNRLDSSLTAVVRPVRGWLKGRPGFRILLSAMFLFALIVRLAFLYNLLAIEGPRYPYASDDGPTYDEYGWQGVKDPLVFLRNSPHYFMVFYAVFLTAVYSIFGHNYYAAGVIQALMNAWMCVAVFLLAYRISKDRIAAFLSYLGVAVNTTLIQMAVILGTEAVFIPLLILWVWLVYLYRGAASDRKAVLLIILAGFTLGIAAIIREVALGIFAFAALWIFFLGRPYGSRRYLKRIRDAALLFVFMMLPILPITCCNYANTSRFDLIYQTDTPLWTAYSATRGEDVVPSNKRLIELGMKNPVANPFQSLGVFMRSPREVIAVMADIIPKRMRNFYFWPNFGFFDPVYLVNSCAYPNAYASHLEFYAIFVLFAGAAVFAVSKEVPIAHKALIAIPVIYYSLLHGVLFLSHSPRYKAPIDPFIAIIVSFGIRRMLKLLRGAE